MHPTTRRHPRATPGLTWPHPRADVGLRQPEPRAAPSLDQLKPCALRRPVAWQFLCARLVVLLNVAVLLLACSPGRGRAQEEVTARLSGTVLLGESGIESGVVTLHEVSLDAGLEIDSVEVASDGSFEFVLPRVPDPESGEVFFASTTYEDILYFGQPLNRPIQLDSTYFIRVYESEPAPSGGLTFPVAVRNVFLQEAGDGWSAVDLIQIRNDGNRTIVSPGGDPIWSYPLLGGARDFEVGQSDLAEDAVRFDEGQIHVSAPIPPGERLYVVRYLVPGHEFVAPLPGMTETMEVLVREPARPTAVTGLQQLASVEVEEGVTYRRYVGADIVDDAVGLILADDPVTIPVAWVSVILAFLLTAAGIYAMQRGQMTSANAIVAGAGDRRSLLREVALLDEAFEREGKPGGKAGKAYRRRRGEILSQVGNLRGTGR